jgi:hypothetical protein
MNESPAGNDINHGNSSYEKTEMKYPTIVIEKNIQTGDNNKIIKRSLDLKK